MVYILLGTGFEEVEVITPVDLMRRAGIDVCTVGINGKTVYGGHGIGVQADIEIGQMDLTDLEMIVVPGGLGGGRIRHNHGRTPQRIGGAYSAREVRHGALEIRKIMGTNFFSKKFVPIDLIFLIYPFVLPYGRQIKALFFHFVRLLQRLVQTAIQSFLDFRIGGREIRRLGQQHVAEFVA